MTKTNFSRGQVYLNPNDRMMLVIRVLYKGDDFKIEYITEEGEFGSFYASDMAIVNNIKEIQ